MHERDKDDIRHQIDQVFRAYIEADVGLLTAVCASQWQGFALDSHIILKSPAAYAASAQAWLAQQQLLEYEMVEIDYLFSKGLCIVPYVARARVARQGVETELTLDVLNVFCQEEGIWRQLAAHVRVRQTWT